MVQHLTLYYMVHFGQKRNPFCVPFIYKWYPGFIYLFYHTKCTKKERKKKSYRTKVARKALNKNLQAYNLRLPQLQLMMATHAQL